MSHAPFSSTMRQIGGYAAASGAGAASAAAASAASSFAAARNRSEVTDRGRGEAAQIADNIIRQRLRIGDPNDPSEVARGLRRLFPDEARLLDAEAAGLPLPADASAPATRPVESMATSAEMERADRAVDRDLRALAADHRLGDVTEELFGWGQSIRAILYEGRSAAALALDPRARDRLFGARRQLNEYSRLVRMVGALSPANGSSYRRLGSSLDEASSLLLVLASETLAGQSLGGLRFLPSVAASDLQARRDAVLAGLRAIFGCSGAAVACDSFPWSMDGLREFLRRIEGSGHLDLRALLEEGTLGRALDSLVELAARNDGPGLRALGATADLATQRLHRLLAIGDKVPAAPALSHFLKALQLFLDTFTSSEAGYRLLYVGRPAIAQRGRLGFGQLDPATERLMTLVGQRARLAGFADCLLACDCEPEDILRQVRLDKFLFDMDRAIDLYTLGHDQLGDGEAEWRAAAYGVLILANANVVAAGKGAAAGTPLAQRPLGKLLIEIGRTLLFGKCDFAAGRMLGTQDRIEAMKDELCQQSLSDARLGSVVRTMAPGCLPAEQVLGVLERMVAEALAVIGQAAAIALRGAVAADCPVPKVELPPVPPRSQADVARAFEAMRRDGLPVVVGAGGQPPPRVAPGTAAASPSTPPGSSAGFGIPPFTAGAGPAGSLHADPGPQAWEARRGSQSAGEGAWLMQAPAREEAFRTETPQDPSPTRWNVPVEADPWRGASSPEELAGSWSAAAADLGQADDDHGDVWSGQRSEENHLARRFGEKAARSEPGDVQAEAGGAWAKPGEAAIHGEEGGAKATRDAPCGEAGDAAPEPHAHADDAGRAAREAGFAAYAPAQAGKASGGGEDTGPEARGGTEGRVGEDAAGGAEATAAQEDAPPVEEAGPGTRERERAKPGPKRASKATLLQPSKRAAATPRQGKKTPAATARQGAGRGRRSR